MKNLLKSLFAVTLLVFSVIAYAQPIPSRPEVPFIVPAPPTINAASYILLDFNTGKILAEKNSDEPLPPASMTKIMTLYVAAAALDNNRIRLDDMVTVSQKAGTTRGSSMFLSVGQKASVQDLIYGVSIVSGNDASIALAEHIAGSEDAFVNLMNQTAASLHMQNTMFQNSTGWPADGHYSSARDMALLSVATIRDYPEYYYWHGKKEFTFNDIRQTNRNRLLWSDNTVDGLKTGHTDAAGYCLAASAERDGMRLIAVVFGTQNDNVRIEETRKLLNYGFRFYDTQKFYLANTPITEVDVWKSSEKTVPLGITEDLYITFPRGQKDEIKAEMRLPDELIGPINIGDTVGTLIVSLNNETLAEKPLVALKEAPKGSWWTRTKDGTRLFFRNLF